MASRKSSQDTSSKRSSVASPTQATFWQKTKSGSKASIDRLWGYADKLGSPVNKLSNKLGSEAFWPTNLAKESEKAARILRSFCKDGFYEDEKIRSPDGPTAKQRVLKKIPPQVIANAKGLAIFTTMRTGLWISGAGGSGVLVARKPDGSWSPPVGILLHTAGLGFLIGVDIYDCVLVLNTEQAVSSFSKWRCTLGGEVSAVAGPVGMGAIIDTEVHKRQAPIFTYLKSRGFYASVQMDGTVIIERSDENERFYGQRLTAKEILAGKAQSRKYELEMLSETLKAAQGSKHYDGNLVPSDPAPADYEVVEDGHVFGVPDSEDPDPYGVFALEKQGMVIKEAGTHQPAASEEFDFKPNHTSPVYAVFKKSYDGPSGSRRNSWRGSTMSASTTNTTTERPRYASIDMSTQTDAEASRSVSPRKTSVRSIKEEDLLPSPPGSAGIELTHKMSPEERSAKEAGTTDPEGTGHKIEMVESLDKPDEDGEANGEDEDGDEDDDDHEDVQVIEHVQQHVQQAPKFIQKPKMVAVPKRIPPPLPPRNPGRQPSSSNVSDAGRTATRVPDSKETEASAATTEEVPIPAKEEPAVPNQEEAVVPAKDEPAVPEKEEPAVPEKEEAMAPHLVEASVPEKEEPSNRAPLIVEHAGDSSATPSRIDGASEQDEQDDTGDESEFEDEEPIVAVAATVAQIKKFEAKPASKPEKPDGGAEEATPNGHTGRLQVRADPVSSRSSSRTSNPSHRKPVGSGSPSPARKPVGSGSPSPAHSPAPAAVQQAVQPATSTEIEAEVDALPGAWADEKANSLAPSVPPRSAARALSKSPVRSRVSMVGIRGRLQADEDDDDENEGRAHDEEDFS